MRTHHDRLETELQSHRACIPRQASAPAGHRASSPPAASCGLPAGAESVKIARDFTRITLRRWDMAAQVDDAVVVISELVTNALRHGLGSVADRDPEPQGSAQDPGEMPIRLRLLAQSPYVMCMVTDPSREIPLLRVAGPGAETGRGLQVIESYCSRWGWHLLDEGGKVVWALLPAG
ncbi:MAG TPA: ATP-binding protein [Streptosporangiaceae bacterium]